MRHSSEVQSFRIIDAYDFKRLPFYLLGILELNLNNYSQYWIEPCTNALISRMKLYWQFFFSFSWEIVNKFFWAVPFLVRSINNLYGHVRFNHCTIDIAEIDSKPNMLTCFNCEWQCWIAEMPLSHSCGSHVNILGAADSFNDSTIWNQTQQIQGKVFFRVNFEDGYQSNGRKIDFLFSSRELRRTLSVLSVSKDDCCKKSYRR